MQRNQQNDTSPNPYSVGAPVRETHPPQDGMWSNPGTVGETREDRRCRLKFYEMQRQQAAADKARDKALEWKATQERWLNEDAAAKIEKAEAEKRQRERNAELLAHMQRLERTPEQEAEKRQRERNAELLAQMQRLERTPEQDAHHRRRVAESDAAFAAQQAARKYNFHAHNQYHGY